MLVFATIAIKLMITLLNRICLLLLLSSLLGHAQDFKSAAIISPAQLPSGAGILATGDLNGDGISDVVYTIPTSPLNFSSTSFGIAFGTKAGFQIGSSYSQILRWATTVDVNGDGKLDIVGTQTLSATGKMLVYLNHGDGTFNGPIFTDVVTNTNLWPHLDHLAVGDFDGDHKTDVVVGLGDGRMEFLHGNSDGTFAASAPFQVLQGFANSFTAQAADLNRDGKLDLVLTDLLGARVEVALGNGNGTFQTRVPLPGTNYNYYPLVGDFDGDGVSDIVDVGYVLDSFGNPHTQTALIYLGIGDGSFQSAKSFQFSSSFGYPLYVGDLNGDGKTDIVFDDANGSTVAFGSGQGQFKQPVTYTAAIGGSAIGDFDGDGNADILGVASDGVPFVLMLKGLGNGVFEGADTLDVKSSPIAMASGDLNGDGLPDLLISTGSLFNYTSSTFLGNADGTFRTLEDPQPVSDKVLLEDLDGDHIVDALYLPSISYSKFVFRHGNGDGTFGTPVNGVSIYSGAYGASLGDLNGDGIPDLVATLGSLAVWNGIGEGTFSPERDYQPANGTIYISKTIVGDLNGDGANDVLAGLLTGQNEGVTVLLGTGDGTGTLVPTNTVYPGGLFDWQDMDGDGIKDLIAISTDANNPGFSVYPGDATGSFGPAKSFSTSKAYSNLKVADLNLDGSLDVAFIENNLVGVIYADGKGGFGLEQVLVASDIAHDLTIGDWNHDGAPDIAVINSTGASPSPQSIALFLNRAGDRLSLTASKAPTSYGEPLFATASVSATVDGSPAPAGSVSLSIDGNLAQSASLANGQFVLPLNLSAGDHTLSGSYSGDGKFLPKAFADLQLTVTKASTTIVLTPSSNPAIYGSAVDLGLDVKPEFSGVPSGSLSIWDGATLVTTLNLDATGHRTFSLSGLTHGHHSLSASYTGDGNFASSTSATLDENVVYPAAITISASTSAALITAPITFTANVSSQFGAPSGTVNFYSGSQLVGHATIAAGAASLSISNLSAGVNHITASYQGDGSYAGASSSVLDVTISDFNLTASTSSATVLAGATASDPLTITPISGFAGAVTFTCTGAPALSTCTVSPSNLQVNGATGAATATIATTGPNHAWLTPSEKSTRWARLGGVLSTAVFGFVMFGTFGKKKRIALVPFAILVLVTGMVACGGGGGPSQPVTPQSPSTPRGTSSIQVTATTTSGSTVVQHSINLVLTVN
jgi:hypothetical protein